MQRLILPFYVSISNGASCTFISSTGEFPGVNRVEIIGDKGKILVENDKIVFWRNRVPEREFNKTFTGGFGTPECRRCEIPAIGSGDEHVGIIRNWVDAILNGTPLMSPGEEGIKSLELSNAMLLSSWNDGWVNLPIDEDLFFEKLQEKAGKPN